MIARLDGHKIESQFERYLSLVREGIAGFIIFGGELEKVRDGIQRLQSAAELPLVISSDLERGLGQQLSGGTVFPPAMALGKAWERDPYTVIRSFEIVAEEAAYAGINTVFAPVLDIDLNPLNPIISTRAFGRDAETVSRVANSMIRAFMERDITACGKHFPGHGDTSVDSHMGLPVLEKSMEELEGDELIPFSKAINAGLPMIMTGHLSVPALDPDGTPVTLSAASINYLRQNMGFSGLITTDAMDMGAIREYGEARASIMALEAGVDILLHPGEPEKLIKELEGRCDFACRLDEFRLGLSRKPYDTMPEPDPSLVDSLSANAIRTEGRISMPERPQVLAITDEDDSEGARELALLLETEAIIVNSPGSIPEIKGRDLVLTVSSGVRAYKGGSARWIKETLGMIAPEAHAIVSFSSPNLIEKVETGAARIYAYWDSASSGRAVFSEVFINAGP